MGKARSLDTGIACPLCGYPAARWGLNRLGTQRYRCHPCAHMFLLTGREAHRPVGTIGTYWGEDSLRNRGYRARVQADVEIQRLGDLLSTIGVDVETARRDTRRSWRGNRPMVQNAADLLPPGGEIQRG